jgi:hypothetical protein
MAKLITYAADTRFTAGDILIKDGSGGTKKILASDAAIEFAGLVSVVNRRNVYRGKNLGTTITAAQKAAIQSGTFDDLFIGDYWVINGVSWVIADMDYWYNCGDTAFTKHHLVIVPNGSLYNAVMNTTNTTEGGYVGSLMYTANLDNAKTTILTAFGDMLLTHREYLVNAVTDGASSAAAWFDSSVELMNEIMVYGSYVRTPAGNGVVVPTRTTIDNSQLSLFRLNPRAYKNRQSIWLRDVVSAANFAFVNSFGNAYSNNASFSFGVRPAFPVG